MEHNYFMFNEFNYNQERMKDNLRKASMLSNGGDLSFTKFYNINLNVFLTNFPSIPVVLLALKENNICGLDILLISPNMK